MRQHHFFAFVLVLIFSGCGGDSGPALHTTTGKVTKGGKPLAGVTVNFSPVSGPSSAGLSNSEGKFVLISATGKQGAVAGKHKVYLSKGSSSESGSPAFDPAKAMAEREKSMGGGKRGAPATSKAETEYPSEYGDATSTPLNYEVKAGSNDFDIVIP